MITAIERDVLPPYVNLGGAIKKVKVLGKISALGWGEREAGPLVR